MNFLEKFFGTKRDAIVPISIPQSTPVVIKGEKHFDIYEDGNGVFRAKHVSGAWLRDKHLLSEFFTVAHRYSSLASCQRDAIHYINSTMLTKVGTIEFIPNR